ncbi:MAG: DNA-processing protein DprA [Actinomycetota bacterium]
MSETFDSRADRAARLALVSLPGLGPARLRWLLSVHGPTEVAAQLRSGRLPEVDRAAPPGVTSTLIDRWGAALRRADPEQLMIDNTADGSLVLDPADALWPFVDDPEPPALLFARGDPELLTAGAMVAIVGTRRCTAVGRQVATELGAGLAEAGVVVVSGLATGIDGCAHQGALAAGGRPVGVVGTGLDVVYPAANRGLWWQVAERGLLLTEAAVGTKPERWRFPARNRLIAGLADAVIVVESHAAGGSMHTVHEAAERGRLVMAVPGAVTNPAAAGTNRLLADGCPPVTSAIDVIETLGITASTPPADRPIDGSGDDSTTPPTDSGSPIDRGSSPGPSPGLSALHQRILAEARAGSVHLDDLVHTTVGGASPAASIREVLAAVHDLVEQGAVGLEGATVSLRQQPPL